VHLVDLSLHQLPFPSSFSSCDVTSGFAVVVFDGHDARHGPVCRQCDQKGWTKCWVLFTSIALNMLFVLNFFCTYLHMFGIVFLFSITLRWARAPPPPPKKMLEHFFQVSTFRAIWSHCLSSIVFSWKLSFSRNLVALLLTMVVVLEWKKIFICLHFF
jgi:hypothetical protein